MEKFKPRQIVYCVLRNKKQLETEKGVILAALDDSIYRVRINSKDTTYLLRSNHIFKNKQDAEIELEKRILLEI